MIIKKQTKKWTTKDKSKIRICDMEDSHLLNTIKFLERFAETERKLNMDFYITCPQPNGEMAQMAFDNELSLAIESIWEDFTPPIYDNLIKEKERRKL